MNIMKLKEAETRFFKRYPGGFSNPEMIEASKKHKPDRIIQLARESFEKENFRQPNRVLEGMAKVVSRSTMVSLFDKPKFRDFVNSATAPDSMKLARGLEKFLYHEDAESRENGFRMMLEVLKKAKLARWSVISVCPFYFNPQSEVFLKPTTVKVIIKDFEIDGLTYNAIPDYRFYEQFRHEINKMKKLVDPSLSPDNSWFMAFLWLSLTHCQ